VARYKHSLRTRVIVAFALTGALIGTLFAVAAYVVGTIIERHFMEDTVGEELGRYLDQIEAAPRAKPVPSQFRV
jgi:predicted membrane protein